MGNRRLCRSSRYHLGGLLGAYLSSTPLPPLSTVSPAARATTRGTDSHMAGFSQSTTVPSIEYAKNTMIYQSTTSFMTAAVADFCDGLLDVVIGLEWWWWVVVVLAVCLTVLVISPFCSPKHASCREPSLRPCYRGTNSLVDGRTEGSEDEEDVVEDDVGESDTLVNVSLLPTARSEAVRGQVAKTRSFRSYLPQGLVPLTWTPGVRRDPLAQGPELPSQGLFTVPQLSIDYTGNSVGWTGRYNLGGYAPVPPIYI